MEYQTDGGADYIVNMFLAGLLVLGILILAGGAAAGLFFYRLALKPGSSKATVLNAPHNEMKQDTGLSGQWQEGTQWLSTQNKEDIYTQSVDGLRLHALFLPSPAKGNRYALLCHGYTGNATQMGNSASRFFDSGCHVLIPDARGHGSSEGSYIGMGWPDRLDIVTWCRKIVSWNPEAQIILYGISMGGAAVMMASGENLPEQVRVIVEDCGYTSVWDEFAYQLRQTFRIPSFPVMHFSSVVTKLRAGYWLGEGDALKQVRKAKVPMMFIHGDSDTFVPSAMVQKAYVAAPTEKKLLIARGAGHGGASNLLGEEYWDAVMEFTGRYVK